MALNTNRLQTSNSVVLDSSGNGTMILGPARPNLSWHITNIGVSTAGTGTAVSTSSNIRYAVTSATQSVNNSTTFVDDAALTMTLAANKVYEVEIIATFQTAVNCDLKTSWTVPT